MTKKSDDTAPATKADLKFLLHKFTEMLNKFDAFREEVRGESERLEKKIESEIRGVGVEIEDLHHDMLGMHNDKIRNIENKTENHEKRIKHLEGLNHVAVAA